MVKSLYVYGLTGGIASGKSTVAGFLREVGVPVLDADQLGHQVLDKEGEAYGPVVAEFGEDILTDGGQIDRQKLGGKVFDNAESRAKLEAITHPAIARLVSKGLELIEARGIDLCFYEAALLVETGIYKSLEGLVLVSCSMETQMRRIIARDRISREAAAARIASQYPLEEKVAMADYVVNTDCSFEETRAAIVEVVAELRARFTLD
jgi:dephospho-CoA kinase